jgi:hypothetical protein
MNNCPKRAKSDIKNKRYLGGVKWAQIKVAKQYGLAERRDIVGFSALFTVATCADFEVKRTVDFVLFRSKN